MFENKIMIFLRIRTRFITSAYLHATKNPYSYIMLDLRQETSEAIRIRGNIFCDPATVYTPKI